MGSPYPPAPHAWCQSRRMSARASTCARAATRCASSAMRPHQQHGGRAAPLRGCVIPAARLRVRRVVVGQHALRARAALASVKTLVWLYIRQAAISMQRSKALGKASVSALLWACQGDKAAHQVACAYTVARRATWRAWLHNEQHCVYGNRFDASENFRTP